MSEKLCKLPALQMYVGDWKKDAGVQALNHHEKGVWLEVLFLMHDSPDRGKLLLPNGLAMPDVAIAKNLGLTEAEWKQTRSIRSALCGRGNRGPLQPPNGQG